MNNQRGVREENEIAGVFNGYKQLNNGNLSIFIQEKDQTLLFSARFTSLYVAFRFKIIQNRIWFRWLQSCCCHFL